MVLKAHNIGEIQDVTPKIIQYTRTIYQVVFLVTVFKKSTNFTNSTQLSTQLEHVHTYIVPLIQYSLPVVSHSLSHISLVPVKRKTHQDDSKSMKQRIQS
jgi:hypothetical protein